MPVNADAVGRAYGPYESYEVSRVKIREFADAVDARAAEHRDAEAAAAAGYADLVAPTTFAVAVAQRAEFRAIDDPDLGVDFSRVVHADQRFTHHRPIVAGDVLKATVHIESVVARAGISMLTSRTELATPDGEPVSTVFSTLAVREDA
ncbi:MAG: MaoC family dehydratase N-terminal domain-containing protein [Demequinaceae bacterium]|nr:MaoC family dehydratase N-terminal domain-containing protein [Demequinaceae bacterium]